MDTKRIRFGFVCSNALPVTLEMLGPLGPRSVEYALVGEKQHIVLTVDKSMRASDILDAVRSIGLELEKFEGCDDFIVTFEKGQRFLAHPFYRLVQTVRQEDAVVNNDMDAAQRFWQWVSDGTTEPVKRKRLAGELASDLVEDAITPSAPKREHGSVKSKIPNRFGGKHGRYGGTRVGFAMKSASSVDVKLLTLVGEVAKSKDETIAAKNYAIHLLETMLKNSGNNNNGQTIPAAADDL